MTGKQRVAKVSRETVLCKRVGQFSSLISDRIDRNLRPAKPAASPPAQVRRSKRSAGPSGEIGQDLRYLVLYSAREGLTVWV
jgi:hypothetical protein